MTGGDDIRVVVCDDHELFRRGLVMALEDVEGIDVVGEAGDGEEAVASSAELGPDVVLMDVSLPMVSGVEATRRLAEAIPSARVVMMSVDGREPELFDGLRAGAVGFLVKDAPPASFADAVRALAAGHSFLSPGLAADVLGEFRAVASRHEAGPVPPAALSPREIRILTALADGATNTDIALELGMTERAVQNHVRNVLAKLCLQTRTEAVLYAVREGIVAP